MAPTRTTHILLSMIALALTVIAVRPFVQPEPLHAEAMNSDPVYVEPGVFMLRIPSGGQVLGKVAVDMRTGNVWGFPTNSSDPYPWSAMDNKPQISHPFALGKFALNEAGR